MFKKLKKSKKKNFRNQKTTLDLIPVYQEIVDESQKGKEEYYLRFLNNTKPDDLSKGAMKRINRVESAITRCKVSKDAVSVNDTAEKILLAQNSEVAFLQRKIDEEQWLQEYIHMQMKNGSN